MVHTERPDWQSVMTYVTAIYKYFETWVHVLLHPTISSRPNPSTKSYYIDHKDNCISIMLILRDYIDYIKEILYSGTRLLMQNQFALAIVLQLAVGRP